MAVSWMLGKVMGKNNDAAGSSAGAAALETEGPGNPGDCRSCCQRSTWRWIATVVVSLQLLLFVLLTLGIRRGHHNKGLLLDAPFMFTFKLQRSASVIQKYKTELEANLSSHIPSSNMKVTLLSVHQTNNSRYAEVRIQLLPDNQQSYNESAVKKSLVKFFLQERNISLTPSTFGEVYDFQINKFPGGLSIVPGRSQKNLKRHPLFNFTLPNGTISEVSSNFRTFRHELARGICLRHNESLITGLTNINGSTVESPVIIQASVIPSGGGHLSRTREKQLALRVLRHRKNLGLNHTLFGKVKNIQLSWEFEHVLGLDRRAPSPAPAPAPTPGASAHEYSGYGYGSSSSPELFYPGAYDAPAPAPIHAIQTGFAESPETVAAAGAAAAAAAASNPSPEVGGSIASIPAGAESPSSSASSWCLQRLSAVGIVLVATAIALLL